MPKKTPLKRKRKNSRKRNSKRRLTEMTDKKENTIESLTKIVEGLYDNIDNGNVPAMNISLRSKRNIEFDPKSSVWKYGDQKSVRTAKTVKGALMLLRTVYTADFIKSMLNANKSSTLREMYYISEGWNNAKFHSQDESNILAEDLEVITGCMREEFKLRPEEDGARVYGDLTLTELTRKGEKKKINCIDDVGDSGYGIPYNVGPDKIDFKDCGAKFVMAIETGGMFDRLVENGFPEKYDVLLVHLKGQPTRSTRRFIKRVNEELRLPVTVFTDGDPWSFRIFASVAYGAIKTAHISDYLATPSAQFIGITPSDILNYDLPTDSLSEKDVGALNAELSDPRFKDEFWENEIQAMLGMKKKAEQQALAKYGLDFVTDTYLPEKLTDMGIL
ncbi:MAG: DNA topoisomerase IV subunit A [Methanomassiliicoccaceae archaeon]|nr:DNA topoisomerase IV subunit A [Methanomassiliicoccaceae archaeon]